MKSAKTASINAYVDYLFKKKLIKDPEGEKLFHPDAKLTRGDFAFMLNNKYQYSQTSGHYKDITTADYYYEATANGKACNIFENTPNSSPQKPVTREQMTLWIYRSEINNGMPSFMVSSDVSLFKDNNNFSEELKKAVGTLAKMQIIKAGPKGNFNPTKEMTRSQIVKVLYQLSFLGAGPGPQGGIMPGGGPGGAVDHGDIFYVTNTSCDIRLNSVKIIPFNDVFLKVVGNDARNGWGTPGKNGGHCHFFAKDQMIKGQIIVDNISTLSMSLADGSQFIGTINADDQRGNVTLHIDKTSKWTLSGNSHVSSLTGELNNIDLGDHTLYVNGKPLKKGDLK